jgi:proline iminopeptidase
MHTYFPPIHPYKTHLFTVQSPHQIYVEECGNPQGLPILYLHGGPGSGCSEKSRRLFDPNRFRIILFDQRGSGRSLPHAELTENHTAALVTDIEFIRQQLSIERWAIFGSSWGATLGLVYAQSYPEQVIALLLASIFLARNKDTEWLYGGNGVNRIFPDYWQDFLAPLPKNHQHHPVYQYYEILTGEDEVAQMHTAKTWATWEARCAKINPDHAYIEERSQSHLALSFARLECYYFINNCFLEPNQILRNMHRIQHIPGILIHGRYDMVCPLSGAWELYQSWPASELDIIPASGHSTSEPGILDAVIRLGGQLWERFTVR